MERIRRYGQTQLVSSNLEVTPIYFAPIKSRSDVAYGQDISPGFKALFSPNVDILPTDSLSYEGNETAIRNFHRVEYRGRGYVIKVEFG